SCGRYFCDICKVKVLNMPHCKECAERIIFQMASGGGQTKPMRLPVPKGIVHRKYFVFGGIGSGIMAIGALFLFVLGLHRNWGFLPGNLWEIFWPVGVSILCAGLAILSIGFYGFYINYGSNLGYLCMMILPISSLFFLSIFMYSFYIQYEVGRFSTALGALSITLILMGIAISQVKNFTLLIGLSNLTVIFLLAAAALTWIVFVTEAVGIGWMILFGACILMAFFFFKIKLPLKNLIGISSPHPLVRTPNPLRPITLKK
ncbi:MAG: hypothetical protein KAR20_25485, partial [Candidatus Heimdallarchaeota archaeon]|nr:hypothetical protein [Candidatus Heimdallarchaeota archaeon]